MPEIDELQFVRITDPNIFLLSPAPRKLFEQVKGYEFDVNKLIKYSVWVVKNPLTYMYALTDDESKMKGILWSRVDIVDEMFEVYILTLEPKYQNSGILDKALDFIKKLQKEQRPILKKNFDINLKDKILFVTTKPKSFMKLGAVRSRRTILEISNNDKTSEQSESESDAGMVGQTTAENK